MTVTIPPQQLINTSLLADLRSRFGVGRVGDHEAPSSLEFPHCILYTLDGGAYWARGLFGDRHITVPFQVTCVGSRRDQAQLLADNVRDFFLGQNDDGTWVHNLSAIPGWTICGRLGSDAASGVQVEGSTSNRLYTVPLRFNLQVTPA